MPKPRTPFRVSYGFLFGLAASCLNEVLETKSETGICPETKGDVGSVSFSPTGLCCFLGRHYQAHIAKLSIDC